MTPQMKAARDKYRIFLEYGPIPKKVADVLVDMLQEICVEYALSKVPKERPHAKEVIWNKYEVTGYNRCVIDMKHNIQQDSLDLPTNL